MLISSPYQRQFSKQKALVTIGGDSSEYDLFNRESEGNVTKLSKSSMVRMNMVKMLFNDRSSTIEKGSNGSLTLQSGDRINTSLETVLGVGFAFPTASTTQIATGTIALITQATSTQYTTYTPFSNYVSDSRGFNTTYFTLNGVLVGAYSYQIGNESGTAKLTFAHTNYLGTPVLETDDKGDIVQMDITDVFGNYVQRDQRMDNAYHNKGYTGHEYDDTTNLIYAHSRFLDSTVHSFLSVDPAIYDLTNTQLKTTNTYLQDPQQQNSYSYARNNPVIHTDPDGKNPILALYGIGILVSVSSQGLEDVIAGNPFQWQNYAGAVVGGVVGTTALLARYGPSTSGTLAAASQNITTQGLKMYSGTQNSFDTTQLASQAVAGAFFGKYGTPSISGVTSGSNSFSAVQGQIVTKAVTGKINSITGSTASKMLTNQAIGAVAQPVATGVVTNPNTSNYVQPKVNSVLSPIINIINNIFNLFNTDNNKKK